MIGDPLVVDSSALYHDKQTSPMVPEVVVRGGSNIIKLIIFKRIGA